MKCKYTFPVKGHIKFPIGIRFSVGDRAYEFEVNESFVSALSVTISNFPEACLPTITQYEKGKIKASISIPPDPFWDELVSDIRTMEGVLCIWGLREINVDYCTTDWIPESESEREKIHMFSFTRSRNDKPPENLPESPMDLFVRSILAVSNLKNLEAPLNFYRRGRFNVFEERYIDAIYDLYFVLETLFANGKFKETEVVQKLCSSTALLDAIDHIKKDIDPQIRVEPTLFNEFNQKYVNKKREEIVKDIVKLRGFLHHHTVKRKDIWHPASQREYKVDALALLNLCHHILSTQAIAVLFRKDKIDEFHRTEVKTKDGRTIQWSKQK